MILFSSEIFVVLLLWLRHLLVTLLTAIVLKQGGSPISLNMDVSNIIIDSADFSLKYKKRASRS